MNIGDKLRLVPHTDCAYGKDHDSRRDARQPCTVVYIHPENRYFTVVFDFGDGFTYRESFPFIPGEKKRRSTR